MAGSRRADEGRSGEPLRVGQVLREALSEGKMLRGVALGRLSRAWEEVVGRPLAARSAPLRLEGGGLVVEAASAAWATQIEFLSEEVRRRANQVLGGEFVGSVRVVVARGAGGRML